MWAEADNIFTVAVPIQIHLLIFALCGNLMSSVTTVIFLLSIKMKIRAAGHCLQKLKESQMAMEVISSSFGYLRYLRRDVLSGIRKQTSNQTNKKAVREISS